MNLWHSVASILKTPLKLLAVFLLLYLPFTLLLSKVVFLFLSDTRLGQGILHGLQLDQQQDEKAFLIELSTVIARVAGIFLVLSICRYWSVLPFVGKVFKCLDAMEAAAWRAATRNRLKSVSPQLVKKLSRSTPQMRTRAVTAAIRQAVSDREINDELISNTLRKLEQDGIVHSQTLTALIGCRNSHHDRYFELQKANAKEEIWLHEFGLARLYSALVNASDTASYEASCEAIYECLSGMDDPMPTVGRLLDSLRTDDV